MAKSPPSPVTPAQATQVFKLLADEPRLRILMLLAGGGEMSVTDLGREVGLSQPATSHHLGLLRRGGLAGRRRDGKHNYYSLTSALARRLLRVVGR